MKRKPSNICNENEETYTKEAQGFYIEHKDRPFYDELVNYMISAPVVLMVLSGENAINKNREIMGATNPEEAAEGTIRKSFAKSVRKHCTWFRFSSIC